MKFIKTQEKGLVKGANQVFSINNLSIIKIFKNKIIKILLKLCSDKVDLLN